MSTPGRVGRRVWVYAAQSYRPFGTAAQLTVVPAEQVCRALSRVFAFVRPSTTWCGNYWVSNYLFGETPPSFEVLA
jgi:hypothetical protein